MNPRSVGARVESDGIPACLMQHGEYVAGAIFLESAIDEVGTQGRRQVQKCGVDTYGERKRLCRPKHRSI